MKKVFISYSIEDAMYVQTLKENLAKFGVSIGYSFDELSPGDSWQKKLLEQIKESDAVLVIVSDKSKESPWLAFEAGTAMSYGKKLLLLSLNKDNKDLPSFFKNLHRIELTDTSLSDLANQILTL